MKKTHELKEGKPREKGSKGDVFFDSIDYSILSLTQSSFMNADDIAKHLILSPKNLSPHLKKLVNVGLLDGVLDKSTNQYVFTCHYKLVDEKNDFGFVVDTRSVATFLNDVNNYIEKEKFGEAMERLRESDTKPEIKKK